MAEYTDFEEFEDDTDYSGTDLVKKLRKQIDSLTKQVKERDDAIAEFQTYSHEAAVGEVLESFGLSPRIAAFIPSDVEADEESVAEWLEEYGDAFGITAVEEGEGEPDPDAQVYEQMSDFEDNSMDPQIGLDIASRIGATTNQEDLLKVLRNQ